MSDDIDKSRVQFVDKHIIKLEKHKREGWILDIGGGGEGIISQLYGEQVIAIDPLKSELEEAPINEALKIIMNAKELTFLDNQFNTVTSFFTMMYIPNDDIEKVFKEIYRVMTLDGEFLLWDLTIPARNLDKDIYAILLTVELEKRFIETGYGVRWTEQERSIDWYGRLGKKVGLKIMEQKGNGETFFIKMKK